MKLWQKFLMGGGTLAGISGVTVGAVYGYTANHVSRDQVHNSDETLRIKLSEMKEISKYDVTFRDPMNPQRVLGSLTVDPSTAESTINGVKSEVWVENYFKENKLPPAMFIFAGGGIKFANYATDIVHPKEFIKFVAWFSENVPWTPGLASLSQFSLERGINKDGEVYFFGMYMPGQTGEKKTIQFYPESFFYEEKMANWTTPLTTSWMTKEQVEATVKAFNQSNATLPENKKTYIYSVNENPRQKGQYKIYISNAGKLFVEGAAKCYDLQGDLGDLGVQLNPKTGKQEIVHGHSIGIAQNKQFSRLAFLRGMGMVTGKWKGMGTNFLKYVTNHEYGHMQTLAMSRDATSSPTDTQSQPVSIQVLNDGGPNVGSPRAAVNLKVINQYLQAITPQIQAYRVSPFLRKRTWGDFGDANHPAPANSIYLGKPILVPNHGLTTHNKNYYEVEEANGSRVVKATDGSNTSTLSRDEFHYLWGYNSYEDAVRRNGGKMDGIDANDFPIMAFKYTANTNPDAPSTPIQWSNIEVNKIFGPDEFINPTDKNSLLYRHELGDKEFRPTLRAVSQILRDELNANNGANGSFMFLMRNVKDLKAFSDKLGIRPEALIFMQANDNYLGTTTPMLAPDSSDINAGMIIRDIKDANGKIIKRVWGYNNEYENFRTQDQTMKWFLNPQDVSGLSGTTNPPSSEIAGNTLIEKWQHMMDRIRLLASVDNRNTEQKNSAQNILNFVKQYKNIWHPQTIQTGIDSNNNPIIVPATEALIEAKILEMLQVVWNDGGKQDANGNRVTAFFIVDPKAADHQRGTNSMILPNFAPGNPPVPTDQKQGLIDLVNYIGVFKKYTSNYLTLGAWFALSGNEKYRRDMENGNDQRSPVITNPFFQFGFEGKAAGQYKADLDKFWNDVLNKFSETGEVSSTNTLTGVSTEVTDPATWRSHRQSTKLLESLTLSTFNDLVDAPAPSYGVTAPTGLMTAINSKRLVPFLYRSGRSAGMIQSKLHNVYYSPSEILNNLLGVTLFNSSSAWTPGVLNRWVDAANKLKFRMFSDQPDSSKYFVLKKAGAEHLITAPARPATSQQADLDKYASDWETVITNATGETPGANQATTRNVPGVPGTTTYPARTSTLTTFDQIDNLYKNEAAIRAVKFFKQADKISFNDKFVGEGYDFTGMKFNDLTVNNFVKLAFPSLKANEFEQTSKYLVDKDVNNIINTSSTTPAAGKIDAFKEFIYNNFVSGAQDMEINNAQDFSNIIKTIAGVTSAKNAAKRGLFLQNFGGLPKFINPLHPETIVDSRVDSWYESVVAAGQVDEWRGGVKTLAAFRAGLAWVNYSLQAFTMDTGDGYAMIKYSENAPIDSWIANPNPGYPSDAKNAFTTYVYNYAEHMTRALCQMSYLPNNDLNHQEDRYRYGDSFTSFTESTSGYETYATMASVLKGYGDGTLYKLATTNFDAFAGQGAFHALGSMTKSESMAVVGSVVQNLYDGLNAAIDVLRKSNPQIWEQIWKAQNISTNTFSGNYNAMPATLLLDTLKNGEGIKFNQLGRNCDITIANFRRKALWTVVSGNAWYRDRWMRSIEGLAERDVLEENVESGFSATYKADGNYSVSNPANAVVDADGRPYNLDNLNHVKGSHESILRTSLLYDDYGNPVVDPMITLRKTPAKADGTFAKDGERIYSRPEAMWWWMLKSYGVGDRSVTGFWRVPEKDAITMWGYLPTATADKVKYIKATNKHGKVIYIPVQTKDTNNLFYFKQQGLRDKHHLSDDGWSSWTIGMTTAGTWDDSVLSNGDWTMKFVDGNHNEVMDANDPTKNAFHLGTKGILTENNKDIHFAPTSLTTENGEVVYHVRDQFAI